MPLVSKINVPGDSLQFSYFSCHAREDDNGVKCYTLHSLRAKLKAHCISEGVIRPSLQGVMIQRVINLLWSIMMAEDAPLEVSQSPAITDALQSYAYGRGKVDNKLINHYMRLCVDQIQQGKTVLPAMSLLQKLLYARVCPTQLRFY